MSQFNLPHLPYTYAAPVCLGPIYSQMGGRYTIGAMRLCDSPDAMPLYRFPVGADFDDFSVRGCGFSEWLDNVVSFSVGFTFRVKSLAGGDAVEFVSIALEQDGTYSVWLTLHEKGAGRVLSVSRGVPPDNNLRKAIVDMYRSAGRDLKT